MGRFGRDEERTTRFFDSEGLDVMAILPRDGGVWWSRCEGRVWMMEARDMGYG